MAAALVPFGMHQGQKNACPYPRLYRDISDRASQVGGPLCDPLGYRWRLVSIAPFLIDRVR